MTEPQPEPQPETWLRLGLDATALAALLETVPDGAIVLDEAGRVLHGNAPARALLDRPPGGEATPFEELLAAPARPPFAAALRRCLAGERAAVQLTLAREDRAPLELRAHLLPTRAGPRPLAILVLHDLSELLRTEREARLLAQLASELTLETSVSALGDRLADWVVAVTGAVACTVVLIQGRPPRGRIVGLAGLPRAFAQAKESSLLAGITALGQQVLDEAQPLVLRELHQRYQSDDAYAPLRPFAEHSSGDTLLWDTLVSVPLRYREQKMGALISYYPAAAEPDEREIAFLSAIADQSVFALENARLIHDLQEKAALEERARLARELHDSVSQALYGIALGARSARAQLEQHPERVAERLDYVLQLAEAAITEMRALIFELRPETLEQEGLVLALARQAASLHARHHLEVSTHFGDEPPLPLDTKLALYRIAQEALTNVIRHAHARHVELTLDRDGDALLLEVRDDGDGFDPTAVPPGHLGLQSMRERAEALGAELEVGSEVGRGTWVRVRVVGGGG